MVSSVAVRDNIDHTSILLPINKLSPIEHSKSISVVSCRNSTLLYERKKINFSHDSRRLAFDQSLSTKVSHDTRKEMLCCARFSLRIGSIKSL